MKLLFVALVLVALSGCGVAGSFEEAAAPRVMVGVDAPVPPARDKAHCDGLDSEQQAGVWAAWIDGSLAGASGTTAGVLQGNDKTINGVRIGLGIASGVFSGLAVAATVFESNAGVQWAKDCSAPLQPAGGVGTTDTTSIKMTVEPTRNP